MSMTKHVGAFLIPVAFSAIGSAWYLGVFNPRSEQSQPLSEPLKVVEAAQSVTLPEEALSLPTPVRKPKFESFDYPERQTLQPLQREWPVAKITRVIGSFTTQAGDGNLSANEVNKAMLTNKVPTSPKMQSENESELGVSLSDLDLSSLSPELASTVESVLNNNDDYLSNEPYSDSSASAAMSISQLEKEQEKWRGRLPALNFQIHIYSSDAQRRWVKINDVEYHQGDLIDNQIMLKEINAHGVIIEFQGEQISIPSTYQWKG
ncbi:hypothetical protein BS333_01965 [Vibrio azureus]|uniref:Type II secretion system protein GspB C-terminal domain-containing protein n=1 Tax=Vibrio azureus NBRC 104587 TaxID=1219077 RepID=U3C288_9VIBR|nr:general secretion pathway protein GspB [Vibrio azureus]AUI85253.1 hypothetical protein BS333_01965 [Vibrio azureus]GAD75589.1 hypothetical protein VAZ01S_027_00170 [Vibrio azureus NBRC 104587]